MTEVIKLSNGRWSKPCSECGEIQSYLRKHYAIESLNLKKTCKKCSNKKAENCHRGWHRDIRISWFNKFKLSSELRKIDFNITIDDVADLYQNQNKKCALTGWDIYFPKSGKLSEITVSIDRIDSRFGYEKNNIQLLYKKINMMKQSYLQDDFINMCTAIYKHINRNK
jgi:hypothetical protein